ncbi:MAG: DUF421 domain-containing protein [Verrucomicrobiota bacterium JB023]|nr:DUF421 domain-containing protein [Verrucomicrobiota bacterium JB023]
MFFPQEPHLDLLARSLLLGPITTLWVVIVVKVIGLRSFSKMTAFDFITTVAAGSLLATAAGATTWSVFIQATLSILAILCTQLVLALMRRRSERAKELMLNQPILLYRDEGFDREAMKKARVAEDDLWAKLRESDVNSLAEVRAIVLEKTGDVSVLTGGEMDQRLLSGVVEIG